MSIIKRRGNRDAFPSLRSNLSDLLDVNNFFSDSFFPRPLFETPLATSGVFNRVPATNIQETDNEFVVELAAPGMNKKDFQVDIDNGLLEIKVEKEDELEEKRSNYSRIEYDYNAFYRSFNLPDTVKADKVKAEYKDGILQVHLPKVLEAKKEKVKQIAVS